jgi:hypothetical protein
MLLIEVKFNFFDHKICLNALVEVLCLGIQGREFKSAPAHLVLINYFNSQNLKLTEIFEKKIFKPSTSQNLQISNMPGCKHIRGLYQ